MIKPLLWAEWKNTRNILALGLLMVFVWNGLLILARQHYAEKLPIKELSYVIPAIWAMICAGCFQWEQTIKSRSFLAGMPIAPTQIYWVKYGFGLTANLCMLGMSWTQLDNPKMLLCWMLGFYNLGIMFFLFAQYGPWKRTLLSILWTLPITTVFTLSEKIPGPMCILMLILCVYYAWSGSRLYHQWTLNSECAAMNSRGGAVAVVLTAVFITIMILIH